MQPRDDRDALRKIEAELTATDPALAETLTKPMAQRRRWKILLTVAEITAILMITTGLFTGSLALSLWGFLSAGGLMWGHQAFRSHHRSTAA